MPAQVDLQLSELSLVDKVSRLRPHGIHPGLTPYHRFRLFVASSKSSAAGQQRLVEHVLLCFELAAYSSQPSNYCRVLYCVKNIDTVARNFLFPTAKTDSRLVTISETEVIASLEVEKQ